MAMTPEQRPNIYVSQIPFLLPDRAVRESVKLQEALGLPHIGVELIPLRFHSADYLVALKKEAGVDVAVAGVTTATYADYGRNISDFLKKGNFSVVREVLMDVAAIGAQSEPRWVRRFGTHLELAVALNASYLAMHEEPTAVLLQNGELEKWISSGVFYARKLGWGPEDNRPQALSWDPMAIRKFVDEWKPKGNIGTLLPTDTALRNSTLSWGSRHQSLLTAWQAMKPQVIQVADYKEANGRRIEKLPPGDGAYAGEIADLIEESSRVAPDTIFTVEVDSPEDVIRSVEFVLDHYRGKTKV